ncbi:MAG: stage II sporulation protein R [Desulfotomaculaceae bacterium]|nr:stage II sporulation protein R [Desulfotomaculaceae bacterium]
MKKRIALIVAGLALPVIVTLTLGLGYQDTEPVYSPDSLIRLHVVSNSDSSADQALKRKVRDEIVAALGPAFIEADNIELARQIAAANLDHIHDIATGKIRAEGKDYPVKVELNSFSFPTKHYGPFILPAGDYEAVRVTIGGGAGANWWCVLFPPLCFVDMSRMIESSILPDSAQDQNDAAHNSAAVGTDTLHDSAGADSQPSCVAVLQITTSSTAKETASLPKEQVTVEYRFKILDFLQKFF